MTRLFEELEQKFYNFQTKINTRITQVNNVYNKQNDLIHEKFNAKILCEKYSSRLNIYREGLLAQISNNLVKEINCVNEIGEKLKTDKAKKLPDEFKEIKKLNFKCSVLKSNRTCVWKIIIQEFKFSKKFSSSNLIKYKHILGICDFLDNDKLGLAISRGDIETVRYLVENGAIFSLKQKN